MNLISSTKKETNVYSLEIAISAEDFRAAIRTAYLKRRKTFAVPGFRRGKAPMRMIERIYGEDVFYQDALDEIFPETVKAAYDEAGLTPVDSPRDLDVKTMSAEEGVVLTFDATVKPEIVLKAYKGLTAEKPEPKATKEDIEREIERMRERSARIIDIDDRPAQNGDIVYVDFEGFSGGTPIKEGKAENRPLLLGADSFIPGFDERIIGRKIDEEFDAAVVLPADYAPELASREATFKVKLREIKIKELPELDDEFAKDMGDYETVDELKAGIKEEILAQKTEAANGEFESAVMRALIEEEEGEIPECMYEKKTLENIDAFTRNLNGRGIELDAYLSYSGVKKEDFESRMRERAVADVKTDLALEKVIELENVKASDEEIEEEYKKMAEAYGTDVEKLKKIALETAVADEIAKRKAVKLVVDAANPKKPAAKKTAGEKSGSESGTKEKAKKKAENKSDKKPADKKTDKKPAAKKTEKKPKEKKETAE